MNTKIKINLRKCRQEDYVFCHNLEKKNMTQYLEKHSLEWDTKKFKKHFNKETVWIAKYKNKRIAFFRLRFEKGLTHLESIQISKPMRKKGIGLKLMQIIEKKSSSKKLNKITLRVFKDNPAKIFYSNLGYKTKKHEGNRVLMEKKINNKNNKSTSL